MRLPRAKFLLLLATAAVLLLGGLALWICLPVCGKSSRQIAVALLEYRNLTATNGHDALGTELPDSLVFPHDFEPSHEAGPDFAETTYNYSRLGIEFERTFKLSRDWPGGDTWTLTSSVRAFDPIAHQPHYWSQQLVTISNNGGWAPPEDGQSHPIPSDAVIGRSLPGVWLMTQFAADSNVTNRITIATNGDLASICETGAGVEGWKYWGKIAARDGYLVTTVTKMDPQITSRLPSTVRQRITQADGRHIFLSADPSWIFLMEKEGE